MEKNNIPSSKWTSESNQTYDYQIIQSELRQQVQNQIELFGDIQKTQEEKDYQLNNQLIQENGSKNNVMMRQNILNQQKTSISMVVQSAENNANLQENIAKGTNYQRMADIDMQAHNPYMKNEEPKLQTQSNTFNQTMDDNYSATNEAMKVQNEDLQYIKDRQQNSQSLQNIFVEQVNKFYSQTRDGINFQIDNNNQVEEFRNSEIQQNYFDEQMIQTYSATRNAMKKKIRILDDQSSKLTLEKLINPKKFQIISGQFTQIQYEATETEQRNQDDIKVIQKCEEKFEQLQLQQRSPFDSLFQIMQQGNMIGSFVNLINSSIGDSVISQDSVSKQIRQKQQKHFSFRIWCFVDKDFRVNRLTDSNGKKISPQCFFAQLTPLDQIGTGASAKEGVVRYRDPKDSHFSGFYAIKKVQVTTYEERKLAYKEMRIMQIVNRIPNGEKFFVQLRCCYFEKYFDAESNQDKINMVFVMESGRCSLKDLITSKRKFHNFEIITMLRNVVQGGALLEQHKIAQSDYKPGNIILNYKCDQVMIIDFGVALFLQRKCNMRKQLHYNGTVMYMSPQIVAKFVEENFQRDINLQNDIIIECMQHLPHDEQYSPCKSDVYSVALMFCEAAGIPRNQMIWCFLGRSEDQKRAMLQKQFKDCQELAHILFHMLLNEESQRLDFQSALQEIDRVIAELNKNAIVIHPTLNAEQQKLLLKAEQFASKDSEELKRNNEKNYEHFYSKFQVNYGAGAFHDALCNVEKCLYYAECGFALSFKKKAIALNKIGDCLKKLNQREDAQLAYYNELDFIQNAKKQYLDMNEYHSQLGNCLKSLGYMNYLLNNHEESFANCDDALTALFFNNQQAKAGNETIISAVYGIQAILYQRLKNFPAAIEKRSLQFEIAKKKNKLIGQANYFKNMASIKLYQHEFKEALTFIANSMKLFQQQFNQSSNKIQLVDAIFQKCIILCEFESKPKQQQQQTSYEETYAFALQIAMNYVGEQRINKPYADYIKLKGRQCNYCSNEMKSISLKKHTIRLFNGSLSAYSSFNDTENEKQLRGWIDELQYELKQ